MRLVYNVYDDENQIESKQFDNFPEALEYAKQGLITYICEEDLDCPECEERVVWTWDSTWDDEEAISNVEGEKQEVEPCVEDSDGNIEITISGPAEEVESLVDLVFDSVFDLDWDSPVEETKVEEQDFADDFGYEDEPADKDLDFDVENPFEHDLYNLERDLGEDDLEIGEPEIVVDPAEESEENQPKKLVEEAEEEIEEVDEEEIEDEAEEILTSVEEIKEIAAEAGEAIASVYEDKPMLEHEDIKEITDEVVENKLEEQSEDELSEEEPEELDEELLQKKSIPTYTLKELGDEIERDDLIIDTEEERSEIIGLSGTEIRVSGSSKYGYHISEILYNRDGEEYEGDDLEDFDDIVELASYLDDAGYIKVTDLDQYLEECVAKETKISEELAPVEKTELNEGDSKYLPDSSEDKTIGYVIVLPDYPAWGKYYIKNWLQEADRLYHKDGKYDLPWMGSDMYAMITTDDLEEAHIYDSEEDAINDIMSLEDLQDEYGYGETIVARSYRTWGGQSIVLVDFSFLHTDPDDIRYNKVLHTIKRVRMIKSSVLELDEQLEESTHAQYAKPEGDKVAAYNNALKYAKKNNADYIYGYTNHSGKFFALEQPIKMSEKIGETEKEFRNKYKNCSTVYVAYRDKDFVESVELEGTDNAVVDCKIADVITHSEDEKPLDEAIKMTKDELLDKEGTTDVDLINAGRPEEERVELEESVSQEISRAYKQLSKEYGRDIEELVYGPNGFMATKYPNGLPDFRGDIIYSDKYWAEFEEWLEAQDQIEEDLEDDLTDKEFAEQLQARLKEANVKSTKTE